MRKEKGDPDLLDLQKRSLKSGRGVQSPTRLELFTVRLMIILGLVSMFFFISSVLAPSVRGFAPLYWMLVATFTFTCLKTLHEWYHYFCITVPETPLPEKVYSVDIFTTFCAGEPYEMIEETLNAIQAITYPHQTYLCDEADDPYLKKLCVELNVHHITRTEKKNAKAGNINNALSQSSGELCVVLDPDHVPFPNFLDPIVSHFNDPSVGYVQIVQAYKNMSDGYIARGAAQQTYQFYGPMMMTMNRYGTVLAIGANCTFRRTALESIGGHAAGLAEDLHTSMQLHAKGWKSVYVPVVLARGLVPSTLSAYYQQQLKWSRGIFDLLIIAYPRLFKHFTWRQKLHYGVIPLHYLSGLVFLINFLIPIFALFLDVSPMNMNLAGFGLVALPFIAAVILIRHFVQWWVMEDQERGFHLVGGLLMTGTWWIYILGFVYTVFRKKVPYVPTPKDGNEANNWPLSIPNFAILLLSVIAIIYGLYTDWSPYTLIMAAFAATNCMIMGFNILISRQQQVRLLRQKHPHFNRIMNWLHTGKVSFWFLRRRIYRGVRSTALLIAILLTCSVVYYAKYWSGNSENKISVAKTPYLFGIFSPDNASGLTSMGSLKPFKGHFDLISYYIPWGSQPHCFLPLTAIDSVYQMGAIPMITWEPWQNLYNPLPHDNPLVKDEKVFSKIINGQYNDYILAFASQIKSLNRPVFIRFAHEADNPAYPWSSSGNNTAEEFKAAWRYIHKLFTDREIYNVIWVWNPWKAEAVNSYFPGKSYVDWIGVTSLNYAMKKTDPAWRSLEDLYQPFHRLPVFRSGIPVMLTEVGSLNGGDQQKAWFKAGVNVAKARFPEIRGFVLFNNAFDNNLPLQYTGAGRSLDWKIQDINLIRNMIAGSESMIRLPPPLIEPSKGMRSVTSHAIPIDSIVHGVNYTKGQDWHESSRAFTIPEMNADFKEMKRIGINTIKWTGPGIYERNILNSAEKLNINIQYSYWVSEEINFVTDVAKLQKLRNTILRSVKDLKDEKKITAWNIGNPVFQKLATSYVKPALIYQQSAYLHWLEQLVHDIKKIDPKRILTLDVTLAKDSPEVLKRIRKMIPEIDSYGLVSSGNNDSISLREVAEPYFFSSISAADYLKMNSNGTGVFITDWQDSQSASHIEFDGLKDHWGRNKISLLELASRWKNTRRPNTFQKIRILKPSLATLPGKELVYHAIEPAGREWKLMSSGPIKFQLEWKLVRSYPSGKPVSITDVGTGPVLKLTIPEDPSTYHLFLYIIRDNVVVDIVPSALNTPIPYPRKGEL